MSNEPMTPEKAVERVISLLQSCKGSNGCLGYIERYFYEEDEQAIDIAIQLLKEGEVYMTSKDFDLYLEGYKQGRKDFDRPQGECKTCRHRDPEDKKCDCGGLERQGCPFPVSDDYFCKFYEKGGAKMQKGEEQ